MATTILKNLKEAKSKNKASHLKNAIKYIFNPKKTEDGIYCGSNCGSNHTEIYNEMVHTKQFYEKEKGRQGYHFVISFPPGEADEDTAFALGKEFCETYLKDYEYAYAVHNDHDHMHCHIVFNSVSRNTGLKYRYRNGDWEKYIQPVTDSLCEKYGLSKLYYEKEGERIGKSYAEHDAIKNGRITKSEIVRMDINFAILESNSFEEFKYVMGKMGYKIRTGHSKKYGDYIAYTPPIKEARAHRDYKLGAGYSIEDIKKRIANKHMEPSIEKRPDKITYAINRHCVSFQMAFIYRYRQANNYLFFKIDYKEQRRVREDLMDIDRIEKDCSYILAHDLRSKEDVSNRLLNVQKAIKECNNIKYSEMELKNVLTDEELKIRTEYDSIIEIIRNPNTSEEDFEIASDRLEEIEAMLPREVIRPKSQTEDALFSLKEERRVLKHILKISDDTLLIEERPERPRTKGKDTPIKKDTKKEAPIKREASKQASMPIETINNKAIETENNIYENNSRTGKTDNRRIQ